MYSPKIPERLVPVLYRLARARGQHMTTLVAELLDAQLTLLVRQETPSASSHVVANQRGNGFAVATGRSAIPAPAGRRLASARRDG